MKEKINKIVLSLIIVGLFTFYAQPVQASFFDWFFSTWSKVRSIFIKESFQERSPASVSEITEEPSSSEEPFQETIKGSQEEAQPDITPKASEETIIQNLKNQIVVFQNKIKKLEKQIEDLLTKSTEIKEVIKEVPVEKIITKEVLVPQTCPTCPVCEQSINQTEIPQIISVSVDSDITSARIEWQTNIPTESKIFISGGSLDSKIFPSFSGTSTRHITEISNLKGNQIYSFEIEAVAGLNSVRKINQFKTSEPPQPSFSIERVTLPNWPNNIFFKTKSENGSFVFEAITLEVNNPYEVHVWNNNQSNLDFIQQQTLWRSGWNYRTCETMNSVFQEYSNIYYPYPCPISDSPLYISWMDKDWMGRPTNISLDSDLPFPQETEIYYYKIIEQNTGKFFEYIK